MNIKFFTVLQESGVSEEGMQLARIAYDTFPELDPSDLLDYVQTYDTDPRDKRALRSAYSFFNA